MNQKEAIVVCVIVAAAIGMAYLEWQYLPALAEYDSQRIQNATMYGVSLCQNATYVQISGIILQSGYIDWCIPIQNKTYCGKLAAINFSMVD